MLNFWSIIASCLPISKVLKDESKEICTGGIYKVKFSKEELEVVVLALGKKFVLKNLTHTVHYTCKF